jgi:dynein heavy chain
MYRSIEPDPDAPHGSYLSYIDGLPLNAEPEAFGMHNNASITCAIADADENFSVILSLQPRVGDGGGFSREEHIDRIAKEMQMQLQSPFDIEAVSTQYPTNYHESMNTVLVQEVQRYNSLLCVMSRTLEELQKALKGLVVLSAGLEAISAALFDQGVPSVWQAVAYPSLKPLGPWFKDLLARHVSIRAQPIAPEELLAG